MNKGDYDNSSPIYYAIRGNQTAIVEYLVRINVDINIVDRWGGTPLNYAVRGSEIEKILLQKGAK
jgi:ankyrin repeat protein